MTEYVPTTEEVLADFEAALWEGATSREAMDDSEWDGERRRAQFYRWLAEHDRHVQVEALERIEDEIRALACWSDPATGRSGFNLGNDEDGEAGARMAVLDILARSIREIRNDSEMKDNKTTTEGESF